MTTSIKGNATSTFGGGLDLGSNTITTTGSITGDISVDALSTATGSAPSYSLRAWVNTDDNGSIRSSGNVSSVTDNATGDFTVNFTTALPSNYAWSVGSNISLAQYTGYPVLKTSSSVPTLYTTSAFRFHTVESSTGGVRDVTYICVMFIG
jgi:hypothetical protein